MRHLTQRALLTVPPPSTRAFSLVISIPEGGVPLLGGVPAHNFARAFQDYVPDLAWHAAIKKILRTELSQVRACACVLLQVASDMEE